MHAISPDSAYVFALPKSEGFQQANVISSLCVLAVALHDSLIGGSL